MTPTSPPTGADANGFYWVSAPNVVPLVVTNRIGNEIAPVGCRWLVGWLPRAVSLVGSVCKHIAIKVEGLFVPVLPVVGRTDNQPQTQQRCNANAGSDQSLRRKITLSGSSQISSASAVARVVICPKPPPGAVNVVLLRRLHIDSGGVSAGLLLGFGFGESKAKGFVSLNTKPNQSSA